MVFILVVHDVSYAVPEADGSNFVWIHGDYICTVWANRPNQGGSTDRTPVINLAFFSIFFLRQGVISCSEVVSQIRVVSYVQYGTYKYNSSSLQQCINS